MRELPGNTLYSGHVMHMRLIPKRHRFRYRVFSLLLDIDRLDRLNGIRLLRHNRFGLMSVMDRDHAARDGSPIRPWVDAELTKAGVRPCPCVMMLSFPRMLGYGFNPLTVYYCFSTDNRLAGVIYEVKNTFGDQVAYTLPVDSPGHGVVQHSHRKEMYVSPFIEMDQVYRFLVHPPGDRLALRIRQAGPQGETLIATHTGLGTPVTDRALLKAFVLHPLMTFRVIALIHWQALKLVLKGMKYRRYPEDSDRQKAVATQR